MERLKWDSAEVECLQLTYPRCLLCEILTEPTIIHQGSDFIIRGWKCPRCDLTLIHSGDIPKALELSRETAKV